MVEVLKDLVAADSECDCVAHLLAVQNFYSEKLYRANIQRI